MKKIIRTDQAPTPIGPYSQAVLEGGMLFVSGQVAIDPSTGKTVTINIIKETNQIMLNIGAILKEAGFTYADIVKVSIFLTDMDNFRTVNEVYGEYFKADFPARETVQVTRLPLDVNIEISVIARRSS